MVTLPSGYKNITILDIDCDDFQLVISGNLDDAKSSKFGYTMNTMAELLITGEYNEKVSVRSCGSDGELIDSSDGLMLPSFYENGLYQVVILSKDKANYVVLHMDSELGKNLQTFGDLKLGNIKFDSDIGYSAFSIVKDGRNILNFTIEVFPSKVDYKSDYEEIVNDINNEISALAFEVLGKTFLNTELKDTTTQTNMEYINILKIIFDDMEKDIRRICNHFKHNIETIEEIKPVEKSKVIARRTADYIRKHPGTLIESEGGFIKLKEDRYPSEARRGYYPSKVIDRRKITTIDIFENRYVKYMINTIIRKLSIIEKNLDLAYKDKSPYLEFVKGKKSVLQRCIKIYFKNISDLTDKKSMTLVFQMSHGYKELYKKYMLLKKGLALGEDLFQMTPKKLYKLYEIWCYIKMHQLLRSLGYSVKEHGILKYRDNGLTLTLSQDEQAKTLYEKGNKNIELWYNKSYSALPTTEQRPDIVLTIKENGNKNERVYIFDAKYRINVNDNKVISPMEDDINVMHKYRDSIVSRLENGYQFKYETFGAYVMFPCPDEKIFVDNQYYKSIEEVNIGALPMLPGSTKLMEIHLKKIIGESLIDAKDRRVLQDELDDYVKFKDKNVMIVNTAGRNHFNKYMQYKFYHIPKKRLSKVRLGVEYLAFYESKNSFKEGAGIRYYAKIKDVVEYKRGDCKEIPSSRGNGDEIYLKFNLGDFIEISKIEIKQYSTLVSYTTLYLLNNASNIHQLYLKSSLEVKVYKKLLEFEKMHNLKLKKEDEKYYLNNIEISIDHKSSKIAINGKKVKLNEFDNETLKEILKL